MDMPMHGGGIAVIHLHAIESDISDFFIDTAVDDDGKGYEPSCIFRPALQNGYCP